MDQIYKQMISKNLVINMEIPKDSIHSQTIISRNLVIHLVISRHARFRHVSEKCYWNQTGRPITGLDYSSLYPSLMMTYNLSPEYMLIDYHEANRLNKLKLPDGTKKYNFHKVKFPFNNGIIRGWSVRHDNKLDASSPDFRFGLFPSVLKELFDARSVLKNGPSGLEYYKQHMEKIRDIRQFPYSRNTRRI
jgi:hypothetical protein